MEKHFDLPGAVSAFQQSMASSEYFVVSNRPPPPVPIAGSTILSMEGERIKQGRRCIFTWLLLQAGSLLRVKLTDLGTKAMVA